MLTCLRTYQRTHSLTYLLPTDQELDYELECANGVRLAEQMRVLPRVKIPRNYPHITSRRVHTAEWVEGE